ncbi:hypothetical protein [Sediminibacter sp. Hel_I_10]|uniref:hypothetical protein n=1 Tax=Sediminibacter sp. Hel_I_10 TaxID=1392490 RepID=UPI00047D1FE8|nr:hypothetical protein [Sediminibacter sp. Hel_I_10]
MDEQFKQQLIEHDWVCIMKKLYAHSVYRLNWFRLNSESRMQGKQYKDFAHEAVTLLFEGKRKWDASKEPDLLNFLKNVVNSLIWNLMKSKEREKLSDSIMLNFNDSIFFDEILEDIIITNDLIDRIEETLFQDEPMWLVFKSLIEGMKPSDIPDKYDIDIKEVRNIQKRLRRQIKVITNLN